MQRMLVLHAVEAIAYLAAGIASYFPDFHDRHRWFRRYAFGQGQGRWR